MDKVEATQVLATELAEFRKRPYDDLVAMVDSPKRTVEVVARSGIRYYLDVLVCWDGESGGNVRVSGLVLPHCGDRVVVRSVFHLDSIHFLKGVETRRRRGLHSVRRASRVQGLAPGARRPIHELRAALDAAARGAGSAFTRRRRTERPRC